MERKIDNPMPRRTTRVVPPKRMTFRTGFKSKHRTPEAKAVRHRGPSWWKMSGSCMDPRGRKQSPSSPGGRHGGHLVGPY